MSNTAELHLVGFRNGASTRVPILATVGVPYLSDGQWRCPVGLQGIDDRLPDIAGEDSMQALCLALRFLHARLNAFRSTGGRLFYDVGGPDEPESDFPLEAYFGLAG